MDLRQVFKPMKIIVSLSLTLACLASTFILAQVPDEVLTDTGIVRGDTAQNSSVKVYKGIPYAAPPIGANRWRAPQPAASWSGVRDATKFAPRCAQRGFAPGADQLLSSEDCLYLNIWTSAETPDELQPVMLWIHGGGFVSGAGSLPLYDGANLAEKGAVIVTFNYRLGTFGFYAHPELTAESPYQSSGNYAIQDAIAALEWIYNNIAGFGGDPTNVTVFGESAGGAAIAALITSPQARGLIHRAIMQSRSDSPVLGYTIEQQRTLEEAEAAGLEQMQSFGANSLAELRQASTQEIVENFPAGGAAIVDGYVMPKSIAQTFADGEQHPVYLMAGSNRDEGVFFGIGSETLADYQAMATRVYGDLADDFLEVYPASTDAQARQMSLKAFNDEMAWINRYMVGAQSERGLDSYVYYFTRVPPGQEARGATHVAELAYVFNHYDQNANWTAVDRKLGDTMAAYWVNFARRGNPNGEDLPSWTAFLENTVGNVQILGDGIGIETELVPSAQALEFFDKAFNRSVD